jgi:Vacuolar sorting protein 9 (VPS9) domain
MHIVVHSEVGFLESTNQLLWQLCDPMQLSGEGGYYLTVFSSIISLLHRVYLPSLATATSLDDAILEEDELPSDNPCCVPAKEEEEGGWSRKVKFWK